MSIMIENLYHVYMKGTPYEKVALKNINLNIEKGELVALIGHTGSGKSTLIQHLNGLLRPSSGKISINGTDISKNNLKELRKKVGIVFQYPEHQLFEETVYKDIAFGLVKAGLDESSIKLRIEGAAKAVGLKEDVLLKSPFELSGGQKRRAAIAGVIVMKPEILVLDEPAAGLDPSGRDEIFGLVKKLHEESGITVVLVSHNMEDVAKLVKRIIVMNKGSIEMDGTPSRVFEDTDKIESIGLSAPQITYLMKKLKKVYPEINDKIFTVQDARLEILRYLKGEKNA